MLPVIWKDLVKINVGEITRAESLVLARDLEAVDASDGDFVRVAREIDGLIMRRAARAIYVCKDGVWVRVEAGTPAVVSLGEDDTFTLSFPPTIEEINALPASLDAAWSDAAAEENRFVQDTFLRSLHTQLNTPKPSEPPSAAAPSSAPTSPD